MADPFPDRVRLPLAFDASRMQADLGYAAGKPPRGTAYKTALADELDRLRAFLHLEAP